MSEENQHPYQHLDKGNAIELGCERQFEKVEPCILYDHHCGKNKKFSYTSHKFVPCDLYLNGKIVCYRNNILIAFY